MTAHHVEPSSTASSMPAAAGLCGIAYLYTLVATLACHRAHLLRPWPPQSDAGGPARSWLAACLPDWGSSTALCACFAASLLLRTTWCLLWPLVPRSHTFWMYFLFNTNRAALLVQFTALTLVVRQWAVALFPNERASGTRRVNAVTAGANFVAYALTLATQRQGSQYRDNLVIIAAFSFLLPLTVLVVGLRLSRVLAAASQRSAFRRSALAKLRMCMATSLVMMGLRAALFMANPVFGVKRFSPPALDAALYPWCFYVLPDTVPDLMFVVMLHRGARRRLARGAGQESLLPGNAEGGAYTKPGAPLWGVEGGQPGGTTSNTSGLTTSGAPMRLSGLLDDSNNAHDGISLVYGDSAAGSSPGSGSSVGSAGSGSSLESSPRVSGRLL